MIPWQTWSPLESPLPCSPSVGPFRPYGKFGWLAAFLFVVCGALRLARFNVMAASGDTKYFKGLPIPAAASMIALTILLYLRLIETGWVKDIVILVMIYVLPS